MSIKQHRVIRLPRHFDEDQRRAPLDPHDFQRCAGKLGEFGARPALEQGNHLVHVPVLFPCGVEHRRFIGNADVVGQRRNDFAVPDTADETRERCVVHGLV
jgi:hypothetical protein